MSGNEVAVRDFPAEAAELKRVADAAARLAGPWQQVAHLPFLFVSAVLPTDAAG